MDKDYLKKANACTRKYTHMQKMDLGGWAYLTKELVL